MRLFVAVVPPADVVDDAARAVAQLPSQLRAELKRTATERLHLTLAFLGDVGEAHLQGLAARLQDVAAASPPLELRISGSGEFDGRVLWLGLRGDVDGLDRLATDVTAAVRDAGLTVDQRRFRPHLTVARRRGPLDVTGAVTALASYDGLPWSVSELVLLRSRLGPVPSYERQGHWPLLAPAPAERSSRAAT